LQDKPETEKDDIELEERKFEPSANDKDLVEILGDDIITYLRWYYSQMYNENINIMISNFCVYYNIIIILYYL